MGYFEIVTPPSKYCWVVAFLEDRRGWGKAFKRQKGHSFHIIKCFRCALKVKVTSSPHTIFEVSGLVFGANMTSPIIFGWSGEF